MFNFIFRRQKVWALWKRGSGFGDNEMGVQGERCDSRVECEASQGRREGTTGGLHDPRWHCLLDKRGKIGRRQVGAIHCQWPAVGIREDRSIRETNDETRWQWKVRGEIQSSRRLWRLSVQSWLQQAWNDALVQHHASVGQASGAHAVREIHSERLSLLRQCVLHDGRCFLICNCFPSLQGRRQVQDRVNASQWFLYH